MPKRTDISSILIIGAGPIVIGQACEFDYSGAQACKALKEEGYRVILVNSNPATIMTDPGLADATYVEPITPEMVEKIIAKERPDALLPTMGGQTGLNCSLALHENGVLDRYGVEMIGARPDAIDKAENRQRFNDAMAAIGLEVPRNAVVASLQEAREALQSIGLPAIIRPSFTLGGTGGGIANTEAEFDQIVASGLDASPTNQVLMDESLLGWKEYEMEVVRDKHDNCIIVCSIENVDPMGVHTGDSITVAPALTLTDKEYQNMRDASIAVLREIGVETGGSNVQFGVNPKDGRMVVIEMNPRVSRSSALASKATGFPIAKIAAKLAVGYSLDELANDVVAGKQGSEVALSSRGSTTGSSLDTAVQSRYDEDGEGEPALSPAEGRSPIAEASRPEQGPLNETTLDTAIESRYDEDGGQLKNSFMPASFEPTIDYVVTKIPRFTFEKFAQAEPVLTSAMKSVGEVMAIGGTFAESLQKALRSLETGVDGFIEKPERDLKAELSKLSPKRIMLIGQAFREGWSVAQVQDVTAWDPWFLEQIEAIIGEELRIESVEFSAALRDINTSSLRGEVDAQAAGGGETTDDTLPPTPSPPSYAKATVDRQGRGSVANTLLHLKQMGFADTRIASLAGVSEQEVRAVRHALGIRPVYKRVDTCAAEFEAATPYMYSTYWGSESQVASDKLQDGGNEKEAANIPSPPWGRGLGEGAEKLITYARDLRKNATDAEHLLWQCLRNRQLANTKFRRQHAVDQFILDFASVESKLAIELDGGQHVEQKEKDDKRTAQLEMQGWRVLRFWNNEVLQNIEGVLEVIATALHPHPNPLPQAGEGGSYHSSPLEGERSGGGYLSSCESNPTDREKVVILGGGPNRIGQGIEFDYACVHAAFSLKDAGYETIMVNCNPETVSTDYDTSDRLYFEPLTAEDVMELVHTEQQNGRVLGLNVQFGGQTPLKLAHALEEADIPLLGTSHSAIDLAEDREQFKALLQRLKLRQPRNDIVHNKADTLARAEAIGYPLVVRPSFVLGGRAMAIVNDTEELKAYLVENEGCFEGGPILLDGFLRNAVEMDVDAIADGTEVFIAGMMEHIEEAGIHSGDSACSLPPYSLPEDVLTELKRQTEILALALNVRGLINIQFAVKDGEIYILEVNPRASRTVPFVAKATGVPVAKIAARVMAGEPLSRFAELKHVTDPQHYAVKEVVFPFARFANVDVVLGPEMKSTGEVMGMDADFTGAFAKAQLGSGQAFPTGGVAFISVKHDDKEAMLPTARTLLELGFSLMATGGTARFLQEQGLEVSRINKVYEGSPHIVDKLEAGEVSLVINTTEGRKSLTDSFSIRRTALMTKTPYSTTATGARELVRAMKRVREAEGGLQVKPLQDYFAA